MLSSNRIVLTLTPDFTFSISSFVQSGVVSGSESLESARVRRVRAFDFNLNEYTVKHTLNRASMCVWAQFATRSSRYALSLGSMA